MFSRDRRKGGESLVRREGIRVLSTSTTTEKSWSDVLPYDKSPHNSVTISVPEGENPLFDRITFRDRLKNTCDALRELQKSSVWVEVPMAKAGHIEEMFDLGFEYHHAQGTTAKLNLWLQEGTESKVPEFATHHVGVGAIVVNSRQEILCVRELRRNYVPWKIPGGLSDLGESIPEAAEREVLEETGVPARFRSILSFRHSHGNANGRSDMYFVCLLDPVETTDEEGRVVVPEPTPQECEIEETQWVPLNEYRAMVDGDGEETGHPMFRNVMKAYDLGIFIKPTMVKSIVPGQGVNRLYLPNSPESE